MKKNNKFYITPSFAYAGIFLFVIYGIYFWNGHRLNEESELGHGKRLVLLNALTSPAQVGDMVQLQDSNNCRYIGKLEHHVGEAESFWSKLLNQSVGNAGSWSIAIDRQVCGSIESQVVLTIPLRNVVSKDSYKGKRPGIPS